MRRTVLEGHSVRKVENRCTRPSEERDLMVTAVMDGVVVVGERDSNSQKSRMGKKK